MQSSALSFTLLTNEGEITRSWRQSVEVALDALLSLNTLENENKEQRIRLDMIIPYHSEGRMCDPFRPEDAKSAINRLKIKKATGLDGIQPKILEFLCEGMLQE